jgi:hypothetical protein
MYVRRDFSFVKDRETSAEDPSRVIIVKEDKRMVLHGKERALEHIPKSSIAFIGKMTNVQRRYSSVSMPPVDHYVLQFDHKEIRNLRGRVYESMVDFEYAQVSRSGETVLVSVLFFF